MDGRALGVEDARPEDRRRDPLCHLLGRERDRVLGAANARGRGHRLVDDGILRGRGRHLEHAALDQPHVLASRLGPGADPRDDALALPGELERPLLAEQRQDRGKGAPIAMDEAAVAAARPVPADLGLEERDAELGRLLA